MADQNFVDYVKICCRSGAGGAGALHFHRAKYIPKGGPDGGNGGKGGGIYLRGNRNVWTLLPLKYRKHVIAGEGKNGMYDNMTGADGEDVILDVPLGTVARDAESGEVHFEITEDGEMRVLVEGGRGGKGNAHFKSSTHQTPRFAQPGEEGKEEWKILELKVLADVGLVGFPNAGKSTLLAAVTAAKPEIADYPFTTITPNLGVVEYREGRTFIIADIPGIIEGAHSGKGLGLRFLKHIERNATLLFMVPCNADNIQDAYDILLEELKLYNEELLDKPRILAITKCDLIEKEMEAMISGELKIDIPIIFISAVTQYHMMQLKDLLWKTIDRQKTLDSFE
jgi:GTP-binding protein